MVLNMSAQILLTLSTQINDAIPELLMLAAGRKLAAVVVYAMFRMCALTSLWQTQRATAFAECYRVVESRFRYAWATAYFVLVMYVLHDVLLNIDDFIKCSAHNVPRPIGIYCAISLTCFVFTSKLSTSLMSLVVMLCAKDRSILTGIACAVNFAIWANVQGTSLTLFAASMLAGAHFFFCRVNSSAALCVSGVAWCFVWTWLGFVVSMFNGAKPKKKK